MAIATPGVATVSPSIRGGAELSPFIRSHGYLFPGGHCPTVGLGGYLLQGGQGWNGRLWGWACESVLAVDVAPPTENWCAPAPTPTPICIGRPAVLPRFPRQAGRDAERVRATDRE
jgi:FAD/FMN-containing dehydrogenase